MNEYPHFILGSNFATQCDSFQPKGRPKTSVPERNIQDHYNHIKTSYNNILVSEIDELKQFQDTHLSNPLSD